MSDCTLRFFLAACLAWCCAFALPACRPDAPAVADEEPDVRRLRVVATIRPLELILRELLDDPALDGRIEIATVMAPEVSPHGFEPTASQVARLHRADLVVCNGFGLDDWAGRGLPPRVRIARFEDAVDIDADHARLHEHDHDHDHSDHAHGPECDHGPIDEHFWVDPVLVAEFARVIAREVGQALNPRASDPTALMHEPLMRFLDRVNEVEGNLAAAFAPYGGRRMVTHHNVFSRLADRYGLGEPIVLRPLAVLEPTAGDLRRAIEAIRADNIRAILIEPQFSAEAARRVSEETGVALVEVDPLGVAATSWSDLMRRIGEAITQSLRE